MTQEEPKMGTTHKLSLVHGGRRQDEPAEPVRPLPRLLVASPNPERFIDLPAHIDFAPDTLTALAEAITHRYFAIVVDAKLAGNESGYALVRQLRQHRMLQPIYLVADHPLPSDQRHARRSGATALLQRDHELLQRALSGCVPRDEGRAAHEPAWLSALIELAREWFASEAEPRVRAIHAALQWRQAGGGSWEQVVGELAELLEDLDDRQTFLRLARAGLADEGLREEVLR
jgi:CheY-like chemotaxis protein